MNHSERVELKRAAPSSAPKRVGVEKRLHIPADVLLDMVEEFMESKGLDAVGYKFMDWDIQRAEVGPGHFEHVFRGVILQKITVKQLFDNDDEEEEGEEVENDDWLGGQPH